VPDRDRPRIPSRGRIVLASASPRRRVLLEEAGISFEVEPSRVSEELESPIEAEEASLLLARRKARAVAALHAGECAWVIGSDTVVALGQGPTSRLLGKPADRSEAKEMLEALSGSRHRVVTGVAVADCAGGGTVGRWERTWVAMRTILPEEVEAYLDSGEWRDKAGGYAIQENADAFVTSLEEGGFDNVVGLPVALTLQLLRETGALL
jgi:septum formation protein